MTPNNDPSSSQNNNRRYSLFNPSPQSTRKGNVRSNQNTLTNIFSKSDETHRGGVNSSIDGGSNFKKNFLRQNTVDMSNTVCQRCKRFEIDLTNTSDNLSATDDELKASRQVISLLQRQLELVQVEKDGLEKLVISQSKGPYVQNETTSFDPVDLNQECLVVLNEESNVEATSNPKEVQNKLLTLIKTQLYTKDEEIVKLKFSLKESQNQREQLSLQLHMLEDDISKMKSEIQLLRENLVLRDKTIVSLSNEVFEQESCSDNQLIPRRQSNIETLNTSKDLIGTQKQVGKLIDKLDAYKKTNELLGANIIKLTDRCSIAEKKEIETRSECQELEAKCCQIQSKLLSLLKEIEQSSTQTSDDNETNQEVIRSESVKSLIKRLLEDKSLDIPLSWKEGNRPRRGYEDNKHFNQDCDELGFYIPMDDVVDCNNSDQSRNFNQEKKMSKSRTGFSSQLAPVEERVEHEIQRNEDNLQRQQLSVDATKSDEIGWRLQWDDFIKDFDKIDLKTSKEFKNLLRLGVPQEYRCKVWKSLVDLNVGSDRNRYGMDYYQSLLKPKKPPNGANKVPLNPPSKQIELDLLRTLPNNKYFESMDSVGTIRLRRVLTAYSEHNPQVAYCQGMNRLAAVALLVLPEEEAFWCLVAIVDKIMPIGYYNDLWLAQVDSNVIMDLVALKMPMLGEHFKKYGVELSLFAWFLTIFVDGTPPALFLRLWDCFLYEGDKIMFRVALALLKMYENQLVTFDSSVSVNNFLRSAVNAPMNIDQFFEVAFDWINPLSGRLLRSKRQQNFKILRSGFKNLSNQSKLSPVHNYGPSDEEDEPRRPSSKKQESAIINESDSEQSHEHLSSNANHISSHGSASDNLAATVQLADEPNISSNHAKGMSDESEPVLGSVFHI